MMADQPDNLVLEQLRRMRDQNDQILAAVRYVHTQQLADHHLIRSLQASLDGSNELLTAITARAARIERRLELAEDPIPAGRSEPHHPFEPRPPKRG